MKLSVSRAYLLQAEADWKMFKEAWQSSLPRSHGLHFLQMATEKAGKAYLAAGGETLKKLKRSHHAFVKFLQTLPRNWPLQTSNGFHNRAAFRNRVANLKPLAESIERLAPALARDGPNPEYPWKEPRGEVKCPWQHKFEDIKKQIDSSKGMNLRKLIEHAISDKRIHKAFGII